MYHEGTSGTWWLGRLCIDLQRAMTPKDSNNILLLFLVTRYEQMGFRNCPSEYKFQKSHMGKRKSYKGFLTKLAEKIKGDKNKWRNKSGWVWLWKHGKRLSRLRLQEAIESSRFPSIHTRAMRGNGETRGNQVEIRGVIKCLWCAIANFLQQIACTGARCALIRCRSDCRVMREVLCSIR